MGLKGVQKNAEYQLQLQYWLNQLEGSHPAEFLYDFPRPLVLSGRTEQISCQIDNGSFRDLQDFCAEHKNTLFDTLLAAFRITHYRLSGADDASIGVPQMVRDHQDVQGLPKISANLQCIRTRIDDDMSFLDVISQVQKAVADAHANPDIPFERIVSAQPRGSQDGSRHPLVQTTFSLHPQQQPHQSVCKGLEAEKMLSVEASGFDLQVNLCEGDGDIGVNILFSPDLYHRQTINEMGMLFCEILSGGMKSPQTPASSLRLRDRTASLHTLGLLDIQPTTYPRNSSVVEVFLTQVASRGSHTAIKDSTGELTYSETNEASDRVARWLEQTGLPAESLIGVLAPRSCQTIVAFLGILKANMAYVPLDVKAPKSRIEAILSAISGHRLILTGPGVTSHEVDVDNVDFIAISEIFSNSIQTKQTSKPPATVLTPPSATSLAYVMFTSGSTGKPKGVMIEHRGIVRTADVLKVMWRRDPVAQMANIAFDTSTAEIYTPLLNGGTVVCVDEMDILDNVKLREAFQREDVRAAVFTPAYLKQCLLTEPSIVQQLRVLFIAGDRFDAQDASKAVDLVKVGVFNSYGPTENSIMSTFYEVVPGEAYAHGVPIGRPVTNSAAYVMDTQQQVVPLGVLGELVVAGDGVARGYTDPARDHDKFVQITVGGRDMRAYRTGDYVRYRPFDGQLEFFGRMDYQVKIRGHRVELPEVEVTLLEYESVTDAVTVVRYGEGKEPDLVSFVTISDSQCLSEWEQPEVSSDQGQIDTWRQHFDSNAYADINSVELSELGRDFVGWTSMYDGAEINRNEMEEWLDDTITTILGSCQPRHVLEIGTGSGMVLFNMPQSMQSYVGLEIAEKAAAFANMAAETVPSLRGKVDVRIGTVADVANMENLSQTDLVVINSTAQYFPTPEYLLEAITDLLRLDNVQRLVIGDVRSYALYQEFQITHALHNVEGPVTPDLIRRKMESIERAEEELLVDPSFFTALNIRIPDLVDHVEILPKNMKATNELSSYRYAAVIHGKRKEGRLQPIYSVDEDQWIDFVSNQLDRQSLLQYLKSRGGSGVVAISNIPHGKTIFERCILESLQRHSNGRLNGSDWVPSCRETATHIPALSVADLHEVSRLADFHVEISWARQSSQRGGLDAVFHRYESMNPGLRCLFHFPTDHEGRAFNSLTSQPKHQRLKRKMEEHLRNVLKTKLPSYMVPSIVRVLDNMPLNANGKVDRKMLSTMAQVAQANRPSDNRVLPQNNIERALCEEFAAVLGEDVGVADNFYDLGGHSLQAVRLVSRINNRLKCKLFALDLLRSPTAAAIAKLIATRSKEDSDASNWQCELYRRQGSRMTLVLIHGIWGQGSVFAPLVPFLDSTFDVLVVHDPFFGRSEGPRSIKLWAEIYLDHLEERIPPEHGVVFGGYSLGGLIAYEMASLWKARRDENPTLLVLLDAATYDPVINSQYASNSETEIDHALQLFGDDQKQLILDHFDKVAPLACEPTQLPEQYHGDCLCLTTPDSSAAGANSWWLARCPNMHAKSMGCTHHTLLSGSMIQEVGKLLQKHCGFAAKV